MNIFKFEIGDPVRKHAGYPFPGVVIMRGVNRRQEIRYVVECTAPGVEGCLHIFSEDQLGLRV